MVCGVRTYLDPVPLLGLGLGVQLLWGFPTKVIEYFLLLLTVLNGALFEVRLCWKSLT